MIENRDYNLLKINRPHYIANLSKWQKGLEQVSSLQNRAKVNLKMLVTS